jgi:hypothetical protein
MIAQLVMDLANGTPTPEGMAVSILGRFVHGGYCVMVFVVLLNRKYAAEFA